MIVLCGHVLLLDGNIRAGNCCRLNDVKSAIVDLLTYCHVKSQSAKVSHSIFCVFLGYINYIFLKWSNVTMY